MSDLQRVMDDILRSGRFSSVMDLQHIESDEVVYVQRKPGHRSVLVDVSGCPDALVALGRVLATRAVY